ncbi:J domain-containing protein DDB_G0295729 [Scaptodrosophila lebanonensis]|uniref:J domain-containing protein DDB_G0295729 n=1 Tax=Drosophila lebanonensis TaxID=7225 RepID=A0A6J2TGV6_DROLE|nr:J domain-containing protein DDB_G0295729 [Scaptodrosophila lebanonensis]
MRLFLLSLLALGAHAHAPIAYRTNLLAYAPARGEFAVDSGLAQGYVRYLDNTGAERLVAYKYPEPLYGIRRLSYGNEDILNPLLRSSFSPASISPEQAALFRAWCEQRYNALKLELDRLKAEGKQPSANMLAQFEPLEKIVKTNAYEAVPGLSPEVQRARDEHLRMWNEARLQVLRAEQEQQRLTQDQLQYGGEFGTELKQPIKPEEQQLLVKTTPLTYEELKKQQDGPLPVQETPEVLRAREEHLKQFNAALQRQPVLSEAPVPILKAVPGIQQPLQPIAPALLSADSKPIIKTTPIFATPLKNYEGQPSPVPVEETPEVKRAREEHLKKYNEAVQQQQMAPQQQQPIGQVYATQPIAIKSIFDVPGTQQPQPVQDTPEVVRAREEHLKILKQAKLQAQDKVDDIADLIRYEERERDSERLLEIEQRRKEEKEAQLEREREAERLREETRLLESERIALQQQEEQRRESERYEEAQRLKAEQQELLKYKPGGVIYSSPSPLESQKIDSSRFKLIAPTASIAKPLPQQQQQNGFFLRIQSNQPATSASYAPSSAAYLIAEQNPFLLRYIQQQSELKPAALPLTDIQTQLKQSIPTSGSIYNAGGFSELDKATREHFRAHEIALEQLRQANAKKPWSPDCN